MHKSIKKFFVCLIVCFLFMNITLVTEAVQPRISAHTQKVVGDVVVTMEVGYAGADGYLNIQADEVIDVVADIEIGYYYNSILTWKSISRRSDETTYAEYLWSVDGTISEVNCYVTIYTADGLERQVYLGLQP